MSLRPLILCAILSVSACWRGLSDTEQEARDILDRAYEVMGGKEKLAEIATLQIHAACVGPRGPYETTIASRDNGDLYFRQVFPIWGERSGGIHGGHYWRREMGSPVETISRSQALAIRFRDFHRLIINMDTRFSDHNAVGPETFFGVNAVKVEMVDVLDLPAFGYFSQATGLPLGLEITDPVRPDSSLLQLRFGNWKRLSGVVLFTQAIFQEGEYSFQFNYWDIKVNGDIDSLLAPPELPSGS